MNSLIGLKKLLDKKIKRKVLKSSIREILSVPLEYLPDKDCFFAGFKEFRETYFRVLMTPVSLGALMRIGTLFWQEKLEEEAKSDADSIRAEETEDKSEEENVSPVLETWTPERVFKALKSIIRQGSHIIRRSYWLCRLSESSLMWTVCDNKTSDKNLIIFKKGIPHFQKKLTASSEIPIPPGHADPFSDRRKNFDISTFDRMRVVTTEIRRLLGENRIVEVHLGPDVVLKTGQLKRILKWV
jgi:hypothetical protein